MRLRGEITTPQAWAYVAAQLAGGILGVWAAHAMFGLPVLELSTKARTGMGQWVSEAIATFGATGPALFFIASVVLAIGLLLNRRSA